MFKTINFPTSDWLKIGCSAGFPAYPTVEDVAKIVDEIKQNPTKKNIFFDAAGDGLTVHFHTYNEIARLIVEQTDILVENIVILCGSQCTVDTFEKYEECIKEYNWLPIRLAIMNAWEFSSSIRAKIEQLPLYSQFDTSPRIKDKLLLCYNRVAKPHRWYVLSEMIKRNLINRSYVSAYHDLSEFIIPDSQEDIIHAGITDEMISILEANKDIFPITLSLVNHDDVGEHHYSPSTDIDYFNNSYFSLINETIFYGKSLNHCGHIPTQFLTEKTFKVIAAKHPFILAQRPGILQSLRDDGYKTFHPYIDESYDNIDNDADRLIAIMEEVGRLSTYTAEQWLTFQANVEPIVRHNFALLLSKTSVYRVLD